MSEFKYPTSVNLDETVVKDGVETPRYGRLRDRDFIAMGSDAPLRKDGALYDLLNLGKVVMPTNIPKKETVVSRATGKVRRPLVNHLPGGGVYADTSNSRTW